VPLAKEVEYVKNYLALEKLRYDTSGEIRFEIDGDITDQEIAPMLFITFVENSFKHGLAKVLDGGYVHIYLLVEGDEIRFHLENNKPKIEDDFDVPGGIGLINVKRRLDLLYDGRYELNSLAADDTYSVDLYLNLYRESLQAPIGKPLSGLEKPTT